MLLLTHWLHLLLAQEVPAVVLLEEVEKVLQELGEHLKEVAEMRAAASTGVSSFASHGQGCSCGHGGPEHTAPGWKSQRIKGQLR